MGNIVKIGLLGAGHLGQIHLKCLSNTPFILQGVYDPDENIASKLKEEGYNVYGTPESLIDECDALDIVSTTTSHYEMAKLAILSGKHTFIEKPITSTLAQAKEIVALAAEYSVLVQVGHVERYNPAIIAIRNRMSRPRFIEGHRLSTFNYRGNDVSVILDLMIHDLDLVLDIVDSEVVDVQANGVCVVSDTPDICNARITFENGCVANLTASRISMKQMRKLRLFQENEYISLDFLNKESQIIRLQNVTDEEASKMMTIDTSSGKKAIRIEAPDIQANNAIEDELNDFYLSITENKPISVGPEAGLAALELAYHIAKKIDEM